MLAIDNFDLSSYRESLNSNCVEAFSSGLMDMYDVAEQFEGSSTLSEQFELQNYCFELARTGHRSAVKPVSQSHASVGEDIFCLTSVQVNCALSVSVSNDVD
jgi:hypothetical protein